VPIKKLLADFRTSLSAKISAGGTSGSIQNNLDDDGVILPTGSYYFTLDADNAQKEHIRATLTAKNLTDIYSVSRQGVETSGTVREHRIGATVSITDFAHILVHNKILNGDEALVNKISYATDLTFTDDKELVPKKYVDDIAIAGAPDSTVAVKGIVLMSSAPTVPTAPTALNSEEVSASGGTGAGEDKVVRANASGYIDKDFIELGTDPGLEFVSNGLEAKIKSAGGLVKDADGLSVDTGTTDGKIVQMTTGDKLPAVDGSNLTGINNYTVISATRDRTASSGDVTYAHGLGVVPKKITVNMVTVGAFSYGVYDVGGNQYCNYVDSGSGGYGSHQGQASNVVDYEGSGVSQYGSITAVDATNITITWTKAGSPSAGTLSLIIESEI